MSVLRDGDEKLHYSDNSHRWIAPPHIKQGAWDTAMKAHVELHRVAVGTPSRRTGPGGPGHLVAAPVGPGRPVRVGPVRAEACGTSSAPCGRSGAGMPPSVAPGRDGPGAVPRRVPVVPPPRRGTVAVPGRAAATPGAGRAAAGTVPPRAAAQGPAVAPRTPGAVPATRTPGAGTPRGVPTPRMHGVVPAAVILARSRADSGRTPAGAAPRAARRDVDPPRAVTDQRGTLRARSAS